MTAQDLAAQPSRPPDRRAAYGSDTSQYGELRVLARDYSLDTARVAVVGHSAGGHLAMWAASRTAPGGGRAARA